MTKKNATRILIAVSSASLALVAAGPATAAEVDVAKQKYVDVLPAGPILGTIQFDTTGSVAGGNGRPIWVTDLSRSHDVQVDDHGIAWVSGRGGIRG